jgi:ABC-type branched-subunit amino acid transport system substrate-binding protein
MFYAARYCLILLLLFLVSFATLPARADNKVLVVGQAVDLSGPNGSIGRDYVAGITTYFDSVNASGGINGRTIKYLVRDDQGNPGLAAKAVTDLLDTDKADYLIGGIGAAVTDAVVSSPAFVRSGQILFAPLIESAKNYGPRVMFWRPSAEQEMAYIFSYFEKLGIKSVGIALQDSSLQQAMYQYVVAEVKRRNMTLSGVAHISSALDATEKDANVLASVNPNIVIAVADTVSTGLFLKQFRKHAGRTFVAGTSLVNLETLAEVAGPKALEWTVFSQVVPNPLGKKFIAQIDHSVMMKKFRDEALSALTLEGFIVAKTLSFAAQMSGSTNRDGLQKLAAQKGVVEIGGLSITPSDPHQHLSNYMDMALFRKDGGLLF